MDVDRLMVRARPRVRLAALQRRLPGHPGDREIRRFTAKQAWAEPLAGPTAETDDDTFAPAVGRHRRKKRGPPSERSPHDVWSVMYKPQR